MALRRKAILETPNRRRRKRRLAVRRLILLGILLCLIIAGIIGFFRLPFLQVTQVEVRGMTELDPSVLRAEAERLSSGSYFFIIPKRFVFAYPSEEIERHVFSEYKEVSRVEVRVRGTRRAEMLVSERMPEAVYCTAVCFHLDTTALAYEVATSTAGYIVFREERPDRKDVSAPGSVPLEAIVFGNSLNFARTLIDVGLHLAEITIGEDESLVMITEEGEVRTNAKESFSNQFELLKTALTQESFQNPDGTVRSFGYIDLRFGKKIFYRLEKTPVFIPDDAAATSTATSTLVQ